MAACQCISWSACLGHDEVFSLDERHEGGSGPPIGTNGREPETAFPNLNPGMTSPTVTANGKSIPTKLPCTLQEFLVAQGLLPRSVVVEHNGAAVAPSEFPQRQIQAGDRLEIVKIVAGG